jgi:hypothetical protein
MKFEIQFSSESLQISNQTGVLPIPGHKEPYLISHSSRLEYVLTLVLSYKLFPLDLPEKRLIQHPQKY